MKVERNTWDQTAYNEEQVWMWSSEAGAAGQGGPAPPGVTQRVMSYMCFQNTKYLFRYMRYDPALYDAAGGRSLRPVSVHVNYHPEKPQRMVSIIAQYITGQRDAIGKWHWGEGMKPDGCTARPKAGEQQGLMLASKLAQRINARVAELAGRGGGGRWSAIQGFIPRAGGVLQTPWGEGTWGVVPPREVAGRDRLFFDFIGAKHSAEEDPVGRCRLSPYTQILVKFLSY